MEEQQKLATRKFGINYGLLLGLVSVAFGVMLYLTDLHYRQETSATVISIVLILAIIVIAIYQFKKANAGLLSIGQALKIGIGVGLIAGLISVVYTAVLMNVIDPDFMQKNFEYAVKPAILERNPQATQEDFDRTIEFQKRFAWATYPVILIFNLFISFVVSLIAGVIMRKSDDGL